MATTPSGSDELFRHHTIPPVDEAGGARQVRVVYDAPHVKIVSIRLRAGAELPDHKAVVPVIIQAAAGAGTVVIGAERLRIDAEHFVTVAPNVVHAVVPDPGTDLSLFLVLMRKGGADA